MNNKEISKQPHAKKMLRNRCTDKVQTLRLHLSVLIQEYHIYPNARQLYLRRPPKNNTSAKENCLLQWKPLIMITLGPALFHNNNRLKTLSGGYTNLHYLTQFIVTTFYMYKNNKIYLKNLCSVACCLFRI